MEAELPAKRCTKCGVTFPATPDYFHRRSSRKYGVESVCKTCVSISHGHKPMLRQPTRPGHKRCCTCKQELPGNTNYFSTNKKGKYKVGSQCRECHKKAERENYDSEKESAQSREYRRANSDRVRTHDRLRREADPEGRAAHVKRWRKGHPDRVRELANANSLKRRARKLALPAQWRDTDWKRCLDYWGHKCAVCEKSVKSLHADHWIPLDDHRPDNPGTVPWNIVPLCGKCNSSKFNRDPVEWLIRKLGEHLTLFKLQDIEEYFEYISGGANDNGWRI